MSLTRDQILIRLARELAGATSVALLGIEPSELDRFLSSPRAARWWPASGAEAAPEVAVLAALQVSAAGDVVLGAAPSEPDALRLVQALARVPRVLAVVLPPRAPALPALIEAASEDRMASAADLPTPSTTAAASGSAAQAKAPPRHAMVLRRVAHRVLTEQAVLDVTSEGLLLREIAPGLSARRLQEGIVPTLHIAADVAELTVPVLDVGDHGLA